MSIKQTTQLFKHLVTLQLSLLLAFPQTLYAAGPEASVPSASQQTAESAPVLIEEAYINGKQAYLIATAIPKAIEDQTVQGLAKAHPDMTLALDSLSDPALQSAKASGQLKSIKAFVLDKVEQSRFIASARTSNSLKSRLVDRLNQINQFAKDNAWGLFFAIGYSSILATSVFYETSSVSSALKVLVPFVLFNGFVASQQLRWDNIIELSASAHEGAFQKMMSWLGRELSGRSKGLIAATGRFNLTWLFSFTGVFIVSTVAGADRSLIDLLFTSLLFNYSVWDPTVLSKFRQGKISRNWVVAYYCLQYLGGASFEVMTYLGVPYVSWILGGVVGSGTLMIAAGAQVESWITRARHKVKMKWNRTVSGARDRLINFKSAAQSCASFLTFNQSPNRGDQ